MKNPIYFLLVVLISSCGNLSEEQYQFASFTTDSAATAQSQVQFLSEVIENEAPQAKLFYLRAENLFTLKKYREALFDLEKAIKLSPEEGEFHLLLARIYQAQGKEEEALVAAEEAERLGTYDFELYTLLAQHYFKDSLIDKTIAYANRARQLEPTHPQNLYLTGTAFLLKGDTTQAAPLLREAIKADSNFRKPYYSLIELYSKYKKSDLAMEYAGKALSNGEPDAELSLFVARALDRKGNTDSAMYWYGQSLALDSGQSTIYHRYADYYQARRDYRIAGYYRDKALNLNPGDIDDYVNLGILYEYRVFNYDSARYAYTKAMEIDSLDQEMDKRMRRIIWKIWKRDHPERYSNSD